MGADSTIEYNGWKFHDFPKDLSCKDYVRAREEIVSRVKGLPGVTIYLQGRIDKELSPGFSDLDFVIVSDRPTNKLKTIFHPSYHEGPVKEVMFHEDLFLSRFLAERFGYIEGRDIVWTLMVGEGIDLISPEPDMYMFRMIDDVAMHILRRLYYYKFTKDIHVRHLGHLLNGIRYQKALLMSNILKKKLDGFAASVRKMRDSWHERDQAENLDLMIGILEKAVLLESEILSDSSSKIKEYTHEQPPAYIVSTEYPILFKDSDDYLEESRKIYEKTGLIIPVLPQNYFSIFAEYRRYDGPVSDHIRRNSPNSTRSLKDEYKNYAKERIDFFNEPANYCKKHSLGYGPLVSFNQHYRYKPISGLKQKAKNFIRSRKIKDTLVSYVSQS